MKRLWIISALIMTAAWQAMPQNSVDALRYSRIDIGGTARYMGLSGAFGALGADFSVTSTNPAGIGLYKSSEFSITPAVHIGNVQSLYNGTELSDGTANFYLGNAGMVMTSKLKGDPNKPAFLTFSFATGVNRLNDFNYHYSMGGYNGTNSFLDTYVESANGVPFYDIEEDTRGDYAFDLNLAWWGWLLDLKNPLVDDQYMSPIKENTSKYQWKQIDTWGSMNEYVFTFATNFNDRLYIGTTFGIPMIRYYESSLYEESGVENSNLDYFRRYENLETHGTGFNIKYGMIFRPADWIRIGASIHSPSWFGNMRDYWNATMVSQFIDPPNPDDTLRQTYFVEYSPSGTYEYNLRTPWRVQGSTAFIIGNIGLVSADYEYAGYGNAHLTAPDYSFTDENLAIENSYGAGHIIRVGTEWRYNIFSFRAGGKYFTSPYQNDINDGSKWGVSAGLGLRKGWFFMDIAYAYTRMAEDYYFYSTPDIQPNPVQNTLNSSYILTTFGIKL